MRVSDALTTIRIQGRSSKVEVTGRPGAAFEAHGGTVHVGDDGTVDVTGGSGRIRITCPEHATVVVSTASGAVSVEGQVADVRVLTSSGRVSVGNALHADVRTRSGAVRIGSCGSTCRIVTTSGTVRIDDAHEIDVSSGSSGVTVGRTSVARLRTVSGTVDVTATSSAQIAISTMSGRVRLAVPAATVATMRLQSRSGRIVRDATVLAADAPAPADAPVARDSDGTARTTIDVVTSSGAIEVVAA
jgi:DUF4097 and DUF4098 domain-containing protein YvlB